MPRLLRPSHMALIRPAFLYSVTTSGMNSGRLQIIVEFMYYCSTNTNKLLKKKKNAAEHYSKLL